MLNIMKIKTVLYLFILTIIVSGCSSNNQSGKDLPVIYLMKNYPEKEIVLTDIAKVTYVHLSTKEDEYLYQGTIDYVSDNTIVVVDESSGSILFFTKDGTPKSRFNHYGNGPQEYSSGASAGFAFSKGVGRIFYDEKEDEVLIGTAFDSTLKVYSSSGKYLRTINCPPLNRKYFYTYTIDFFDNKSFIINDADSFYLISKVTAELLEYVEIPKNDVNLINSVNVVRPDGRTTTMVSRGLRMVRSTDGFNFCLPGDTVYYFDKNKVLKPVLCTSPSSNDLEQKIVLDNFWDVGKYQFMRIHTMHYSNYIEGNTDRPYPDKHYVRDKKTGEVFRQKIILPDYDGKEIFISAYPLQVFQEKTTYVR